MVLNYTYIGSKNLFLLDFDRIIFFKELMLINNINIDLKRALKFKKLVHIIKMMFCIINNCEIEIRKRSRT